MIERIYGDGRMLICDNCGEGAELDDWEDVREYMKQEGWIFKKVDRTVKHYCEECKMALKEEKFI